MSETGFSAERYIEEQSRYIIDRIENSGGDRLYMEFGASLYRTGMP